MLTKRSLTVAGETSLIDQEPAKAALARDALVKIMYARLFDWIVMRVNKTVDASGDTSDRYIGLLDVYGFEFFELNSFEQVSRTPSEAVSLFDLHLVTKYCRFCFCSAAASSASTSPTKSCRCTSTKLSSTKRKRCTLARLSRCLKLRTKTTKTSSI